MDFEERKYKILSAIIKRHIEFGAPVGSKTVCEALDISLSSATVRNEMAELSVLGYLEQPYTSAGRVPSDLGYRLYVNRLMEPEALTKEEKSYIDGVLCSAADGIEHLLNEAVKLLAKITNLTSILATPKNYDTCLKKVRFIITGKRNAMLVLITTAGSVKTKQFRCNYNITKELVDSFEKVINEKFQGKLLRELTPEFVNILASAKSEMVLLMTPVLNALMEAAREALEINIKVAGEVNLLSTRELSPGDVIKAFKFLKKKEDILGVLFSRERGVNVFIGEEDLPFELREISILVSRYITRAGIGAVGLVGPVRMDYGGLTAKIKYLTSALEVWLSRILELAT